MVWFCGGGNSARPTENEITPKSILKSRRQGVPVCQAELGQHFFVVHYALHQNATERKSALLGGTVHSITQNLLSPSVSSVQGRGSLEENA